VAGLGSSGYVSTLTLFSTSAGLTQVIATGLSTLSSAIFGAPTYQGQLLFMNQTTNVSPYKQLTPFENISTLHSTITSLPPNSDSNLLAAFQSDFQLPAFIPDGFWDMNLFAEAGGSGLRFYFNILTRAPDTTEQFLFGASPIDIPIIGIEQYTNTVPVSYTNLPAASTLVVKLYGSNSSGTSQNLTCYFQGNYYSHIHTSFNGGQETGSSGVSSLSTFVSQMSNFFSSQIVSTNNNLVSTVAGLGSSGYVSTATMFSSIHSAISSLSTAYGVVGAGGLANIPSTLSTFAILTSSLRASTITADYISTLSLWVCTINGLPPGSGGIANIPSSLSTFAFFTSSASISSAIIGTMSSLVTNASTANITVATTSSVTTNTITVGSGPGWLLTSPIQTVALSTNTLYADVTYVNTENVTTGNISTIATNNLTVGTGGGWLLASPIQTTVISSIVSFADQGFINSLNIGSLSTVNAITYNGLFGNDNNTVLAEISTGAGLQELLVFKGSSASDRVRVQTTGNFVVETGVSARLWNPNTSQTLSNVTPAFIVNTSSNVGIQTANPGATLDVAGTGRFQILSTQTLNTSSINGDIPITLSNQVSTVRGLGTAGYLSTGLQSIPASLSTFQLFTSSLLTSTLTTQDLRVGLVSTVNAITYNGLFGNYNNTAIAEISTGAGLQELLVFKGSSASDRVRVQTTGNFVIETGVSARLWNSNTTQTLSNITPAFIVNTSSNVGIQTANPGATLDVAGSGRFFTISTQSLTAQSSLTVVGRSASTFGFTVNLSSMVGLNVSTPLAQLYLKDLPFPSPTPAMTIYDKDPTSLVTPASQTYTGVYVFYTVPASVTSITFNLWGAGGIIGGGGAFVQAVVPTTPGEQLRLIIGLGGSLTSLDPTDAQGAAGSNTSSGQDGRGGGRTAVQKFIGGSWVEVLTAGGGGGGTSAFGGATGGNATWIGTSAAGQGLFGDPGGGGGTQSSGGAGAAGGGSGSFQKGGTSRFLGGSGGGGYFGGGGAHSGGGGASFVLSTLGGSPFVTNYTGINGNGGTPIGTNQFGYISGVGVSGGNGLIALQYSGFRESDYINLNRGGTTIFAVNAVGGLAVSKSAVTPNYALDVAGNILATQETTTIVSTQALFASSLTASFLFTSTISTQNIALSTINGDRPITLSNQISTVQGLQTFISSFIDPSELASSVLQFISSTYFTNQLNSTVGGLGSAGYVSTASMNSSINQAISSLSTAYGFIAGGGGIATIPSVLSTFALFTSSLTASTINTLFLTASTITAGGIFASTGLISSFSTNVINFAGGFGYLTMPDIFPTSVYTSTVIASNLLVGWNSQVSPIQFYGFGNYTNTVVAEVSTGGTTQELLLFRGSNASDRIRFQTTGSLVFEPGVSARVWPTVPSNATPAMVINTSSNVGIQLASPAVPLDVGGAIRGVTISTQQLATSSIINNPRIVGATFTSSVSFLGPSTFLIGALSTSFMTAGTPEIDFFTNNILRMAILSNGNVGIGTAGPSFLLDVAGTTRVSTLFVSSITAFNNVSTVQFEMSSVVGNNVRGNVLSSLAMGASTFTGKWNDAQYYVLQTI